jgi:photosystem II stability/assembly factor-like uncharacterized protein
VFVNRWIGWAVGVAGTVLHTTDGGDNWHSQDSGVAENLYAMIALDQESAWAVGQRGIILKYARR